MFCFSRPSARIPLWVKLAYTAFVCVLVPHYLWAYGPTNFLYFCDVALLMTLVAVWRESSLWASMPAVGILLPQSLWIVDYLGGLCGFRVVGMTAYMFDPGIPLFARDLIIVARGRPNFGGPNREAIEVIGGIGPTAKAAVPALMELLGYFDVNCHAAAAHALARIGTAALDPLIAVTQQTSDAILAAAEDYARRSRDPGRVPPPDRAGEASVDQAMGAGGTYLSLDPNWHAGFPFFKRRGLFRKNGLQNGPSRARSLPNSICPRPWAGGGLAWASRAAKL